MKKEQIKALNDLFPYCLGIGEKEQTYWLEVTNAKQADLMQKISQTAIGDYYRKMTSEGQVAPGTRWLCLIGSEGVHGMITAQPSEGYNPDLWPHASHITGPENIQIEDDVADEILRKAAACNLFAEMNHMGQQPEIDQDNGMEP